MLFRYITEPPHGAPLYALLVNVRAVGSGRHPALFFASTVHVSPERELVALNGYGKDSLLHVVHLTQFRSWWLPGMARISGVDAHGVTAELWPTGKTNYDPPKTYPFPPLAEWTQPTSYPNTYCHRSSTGGGIGCDPRSVAVRLDSSSARAKPLELDMPAARLEISSEAGGLDTPGGRFRALRRKPVRPGRARTAAWMRRSEDEHRVSDELRALSARTRS